MHNFSSFLLFPQNAGEGEISPPHHQPHQLVFFGVSVSSGFASSCSSFAAGFTSAGRTCSLVAAAVFVFKIACAFFTTAAAAATTTGSVSSWFAFCDSARGSLPFPSPISAAADASPSLPSASAPALLSARRSSFILFRSSFSRRRSSAVGTRGRSSIGGPKGAII